MAKSKTDLSRKIEAIVQHTSPLPAESTCPLLHFERTATSSVNLLKYINDHLTAAGASGALHGENMSHLHRMVLVSLIEAFETILEGACRNLHRRLGRPRRRRSIRGVLRQGRAVGFPPVGGHRREGTLRIGHLADEPDYQ